MQASRDVDPAYKRWIKLRTTGRKGKADGERRQGGREGARQKYAECEA
jgi:hypothetical protein